MALITLPAGVRIAALEWRQPPSYAFNRSELTGKSRAVQLGPASRWSASGRLTPTKGNDARAVRSFLAQMSNPGTFLQLPILTGLQRATAPFSATVQGAGQLGYSLQLTIGPLSQTILRAGDIISVVLTADDYQPIVLTADLITDGAGNALASLATPLRRSPANGAGVNIGDPVAIMRMRDPLAWSATPGGIFQSEVAFEEAF